MERLDFLLREAIRSPEMELKVRAVFAENTALHEEVSQLKDENAILVGFLNDTCLAAQDKF